MYVHIINNDQIQYMNTYSVEKQERGFLLPETLDDYRVRVTSHRYKVPAVILTIIFVL